MKHTKTVKVLLIPSLIALLLCGCMSQTAKQTIEDYNRVLEEVQTLERLIPNANNNAFTGEIDARSGEGGDIKMELYRVWFKKGKKLIADIESKKLIN